ncbi:MAG: acyloxyacyl hydrolase [Alphaproteobacteria bacterium]|nr:acyloxyacyl hydrolase [Alphaproteobacteria bacterium]
MRLDTHDNTSQDYRRAREMRNIASPVENKLWVVLREAAKASGLKFRRQQAVHPFIAAFACMKARLLVEQDGDSHANSESYDRSRDKKLKEMGFVVLRFANDDVVQNAEGVAMEIVHQAGRLVKENKRKLLPKALLALALFGVLSPLPAAAAATPDYLSFGLGAYDFDKGDADRKSVDYRLEYESGVSLLPLITKSFNSVEPFLQAHPTLGFEGNTHGAIYANGGINFDIPFLRHGIFTWGEAAGAFARGNDARSVGSVLEFRSQLELGWRFDNDLRMTGFISHISNAHLVDNNPGAEIAGIYLHVPLTLLAQKNESSP